MNSDKTLTGGGIETQSSHAHAKAIRLPSSNASQAETRPNYRVTKLLNPDLFTVGQRTQSLDNGRSIFNLQVLNQRIPLNNSRGIPYSQSKVVDRHTHMVSSEVAGQTSEIYRDQSFIGASSFRFQSENSPSARQIARDLRSVFSISPEQMQIPQSLHPR